MSLSKIVKIGALTVLAFDALWFLRLAATKLVTLLIKSKLNPLDESRVYSLCTTHDLDFMGHMNNARYFRELDFGRFDFWFRSGLSRFVKMYSKRYVVQHACTIRYRRPINFLRPYVIRTRLLWWDSRSLYFEQRLQTLHDGFTRAIAISRNTIVNADVEEIMEEMFETAQLEYFKPEIRQDLATWLTYNQLSSEFLMQEVTPTIEANGSDGQTSGMTSMRSFCVSPAPFAEASKDIVAAVEKNRLHVK